MRREIALPGSLHSVQPLRLCQGKCQTERQADGGLQVNASKWVCASCAQSLLRRFR